MALLFGERSADRGGHRRRHQRCRTVLQSGERPAVRMQPAGPRAPEAARGWRGEAKRHGSSDRIHEPKGPSAKQTREACESLWFLVFGAMVDHKHKDAILEQKRGTKDEVMKLHAVWSEMDEDGSGDVEFDEFLSFFSKKKADRLLGMRCVDYLVGKAKDEGVDDKEMGCTIDDMMRLMWLRATDEDLAMMMHWFKEAEYQKHRVQTPPLLPRDKRNEILDNFSHLVLSRGSFSFHELVAGSCVDEITMKGLLDQLSVSQWDMFEEKDVLNMCCPQGYLAHENMNHAVDQQGRPLRRVSNEYFEGWLLAVQASKLEGGSACDEGDSVA